MVDIVYTVFYYVIDISQFFIASLGFHYEAINS